MEFLTKQRQDDLKNDSYKNISIINGGAVLREWNSNTNQANKTN